MRLLYPVREDPNNGSDEEASMVRGLALSPIDRPGPRDMAMPARDG